jgi:hypothetical protein
MAGATFNFYSGGGRRRGARKGGKSDGKKGGNAGGNGGGGGGDQPRICHLVSTSYLLHHILVNPFSAISSHSSSHPHQPFLRSSHLVL